MAQKDKGKFWTRVIAGLLAGMMLLGAGGSIIYYLIFR